MKAYSTLASKLDGDGTGGTLIDPQEAKRFYSRDVDEAGRHVSSGESGRSSGTVILTGTGPSFCVGMDLSVDGKTFLPQRIVRTIAG